MPVEKAPLERLDPDPIPRTGATGNFARIRPMKGEKLENGALCEDPSHGIVRYGRRVTVRGEARIRDSIWVCAVCKPRAIPPPPKRTYEPEERHEIPEPVYMGWAAVNRIVGVAAPRVPPWYPGPEPKLAEGASQAETAAWRRAHKSWERWSRECWSARASLVSLHQRRDEAPSGSLRDFEL